MPASLTNALLLRWFSIELTEDQSKAADIGTFKPVHTKGGASSRGWCLDLDFGDALFAPLEPVWVGENRPFSSCVTHGVFVHQNGSSLRLVTGSDREKEAFRTLARHVVVAMML
jgi:hypothetical protein